MKCKILLTKSHCSCYVRKSQEEDYQLHYIEGEEFFDFRDYDKKGWRNLIDYLATSLGLDNNKNLINKETAYIANDLNIEIISYETNQSVLVNVKDALNLYGYKYETVELKKILESKKIENNFLFSLHGHTVKLNNNSIIHLDEDCNKNIPKFNYVINYSKEKTVKKNEDIKKQKESNNKDRTKEINEDKLKSMWKSYFISKISYNRHSLNGRKFYGYAYKLIPFIIIRDDNNTIEILLKQSYKKLQIYLNEKVEIDIDFKGCATITKIKE